MKSFIHINASSVEEAASTLGDYGGNAVITAGGTDILGAMKDMVLPEYPEAVVNIKSIQGLDYITEEGGMLKIGALTKLKAIAENTIVIDKYPALAKAAARVASPPLRTMGTIGGNLCQDTRCPYYRASFNRFFCFRKGGTLCFATLGETRYTAILGGQVCFAAFPSDTAIALTALGATLITNRGNIQIGDFYGVLGNVLETDEIVTEVQVPEPQAGTKQDFIKISLRQSIDFAIASVAVSIAISGGNVEDASIVLGGVAPVPYKATGAEDALKGNAISDSVADAAGAAAVSDAFPLGDNAYKIQIANTLVKRAILS
jgi:xanthine dehydrogenase YagS FAD-binding subunit